MRNAENWKFFRKLLFRSKQNSLTSHSTSVSIIRPTLIDWCTRYFQWKICLQLTVSLTHYLPLFGSSKRRWLLSFEEKRILNHFLLERYTTASRCSSPYIDVICTKGKWKFIELTEKRIEKRVDRNGKIKLKNTNNRAQRTVWENWEMLLCVWYA